MEKEKKSLLDFCYILKGYNSVSLPQWLTENNYHQSQCGLINMPNSKGMYALFYDAESIYYPPALQRAVIIICHHTLHRVRFESSAGAITRERSLHRAICINKVGVVMLHYIHHA